MPMFNLDPGFASSALKRHQAMLNTSLERLSTGKAINRASDDPAGLMRADSLMFDIRTIEKNLESGQLAQFFAGAADGSLSGIADMLLELKGLIGSAANHGALGGNERKALQDEADSILKGISFAINTSVFRGQRILAEGFAVKVGSTGVSMAKLNLTSMGAVTREPDTQEGNKSPLSQSPPSAQPGQPDAGTEESEQFSIANMKAGGSLNLLTGDLEMASKSIDSAINGLAMKRAGMGAALRGIEADMNVWAAEFEALTGAHSDLMDLDYAKETSQLVRAQLMRDAALKAVVIGRENAQRSLDLLVNSTSPLVQGGRAGLSSPTDDL